MAELGNHERPFARGSLDACQAFSVGRRQAGEIEFRSATRLQIAYRLIYALIGIGLVTLRVVELL